MCDSNFWLDLNYLEVAGAAQMYSAHFTALLYSEIYVDKIRSNMEQNRRYCQRLLTVRLYVICHLLNVYYNHDHSVLYSSFISCFEELCGDQMPVCV